MSAAFEGIGIGVVVAIVALFLVGLVEWAIGQWKQRRRKPVLIREEIATLLVMPKAPEGLSRLELLQWAQDGIRRLIDEEHQAKVDATLKNLGVSDGPPNRKEW